MLAIARFLLNDLALWYATHWKEMGMRAITPPFIVIICLWLLTQSFKPINFPAVGHFDRLYRCVFTGVGQSLSNTQLLHLLWKNFDYWFVQVQVVFAWLGLADLLRWNASPLALVPSYLWLQWVLLLDAMTPVMSQQLWFTKKRYASMVVLVLFIHGTLLLYPLFAYDGITDNFQDRILSIGHIRTLDMHLLTIPFAVYRFMTQQLVVTEAFLWHILRYEDNQLLLLHGAVEYYSPPDVLPPLVRHRSIHYRLSL